MLRRFNPATRLLCGASVLATTLLAPLSGQLHATLWHVSIASSWSLCCALPRAVLIRLLRFAIALYIPALLLISFASFLADMDLHTAFTTTNTIILRSVTSVIICVATGAALNTSELNRALLEIPIPQPVSTLIVQVIHQSEILLKENRSMLAALQLRGVNSAPLKLRLRCICAVPTLWILRLAARAERVGDAMELRNFRGAIKHSGSAEIPRPDRFLRLLALLLLVAVVTLKIYLRNKT